MNRFGRLFERDFKRAFIPFLVLGDPDPETSYELMRAAIDAGASALELGIPFSDPIADGPTIQRSTERALRAGATVESSIRLIERLRRSTSVPIGLLVYYNLIYRKGVDAFCQRVARAGVDAVLAADLPLEESADLACALQARDLGCVHLVAPNTPLPRALQLVERSTAFAYILGGFGTTGERAQLSPRITDRIRELRGHTATPLVVGFGISRSQHIESLYAAGASGVIVGSALIAAIEKNLGDREGMVRAVQQSVKNLIHREGAKQC